MATRTISNSGGTRNWNDTASWVEGVVPTAADDVVATGTSGNLTINVNPALCRSISLTAYTATLTHTADMILTVGDASGGALNFSGSWTYVVTDYRSGVTFASPSNNGGVGWAVTSGGKQFSFMRFAVAGGKWVLQDNLQIDKHPDSAVQLSRGELDTNSKTITAGCVRLITGPWAKVLTMGSTVWNLSATSGDAWWCTGNEEYTITANTAVVNFTANGNFNGASLNWNGLSLNFTGSGSTTVIASTLGSLTKTGGTTLAIGSSNLTLTGNFTTSGTAAQRLKIWSSVGGTQRTITCNGTVTTSYTEWESIIAAGSSAPWNFEAVTGGAVGNIDAMGAAPVNIKFPTATPTYRSTTYANGTGTSAVVNTPAGTVAGDYLIYFIEYNWDNIHGAPTLTLPSGFTSRHSAGWQELSWMDANMVVATKTATGSEGATLTSTFSGLAVEGWFIWCVAISNANGYITVSSTGTDYFSPVTSAVLPSVTMSARGILVALIASGTGTNPTLPSGMTSIAATGDYRLAYEVVPLGATGTRTSTHGSVDSYGARMIAIKAIPGYVTTENVGVGLSDSGMVTIVVNASDSLTAGVAETRVIAGTLPGTDTLAAAVTESKAITASITVTDTPTIGATEAGVTLIVGLAKTAVDTLAVTIANVGNVYAPNVTVELWEAGVFVATLGNYSALTESVLSIPFNSAVLADPSGADVEIRLTGVSADVGAIEWNATYSSIVVSEGEEETPVAGSDTLAAAITEVSALQRQSTSTETLALTVADATSGILAARTTADAPTIGATEVSATMAARTTADTPTVGITDATATVAAVLSGTDAPTAGATEASATQTQRTTADTLAAAITDATVTTTVTTARADTLAASVAEVSAIMAARTTADTLALGATESYVIAAVLAAVDTEALGITDAVASQVAVNTAIDTLVTAIAEVSAQLRGYTATDTLAVTSADATVTTAVTTTGTDALAAILSEVSAAQAIFAKTDTLAAGTTEATALAAVIAAVDAPTSGATEASAQLGVLTGTDTPAVSVADAAATAVTVDRADTLAATLGEGSSTAVTTSTADTLLLTGAEVSATQVQRTTADAPTLVSTEASAQAAVTAAVESLVAGTTEESAALVFLAWTDMLSLLVGEEGPGAAVPWEPDASLDMGVWLDASKITGLSDGDPVSSWADASGAGATTVSTGFSPPTYETNGLNGLPVIRFVAASQQALRTTMAVNVPYSVAIVGRMTGGTNGRLVGSIYPTAQNWLVGWWNGYEDTMYAEGFVVPGSVSATTNWNLYTATGSGTLSSFWESGGLLGSGAQSAGPNNRLALSGYAPASYEELSDGELAEVIVFDRVLTDAERQKVEGYLAWKYGMQAQLPVDHPYYDAAPMVAGEGGGGSDVAVTTNTIDALALTSADVSATAVVVDQADTGALQIFEASAFEDASLHEAADSLVTGTTETSSSAVFVAVADSLGMSVTDLTALLQGIMTRADTLGITAAEVAQTVATLVASNAVALAVAEVSATQAQRTTSDPLVVGAVEGRTLAVTVAALDTVALLTLEAYALAVSVGRADTLGMTAAETATVIGTLATTDALAVAMTEVSATQVQQAAQDTLALLGAITTTTILAAVNRADTLIAGATEATSVQTARTVADTLITGVTETSASAVTLTRADVLAAAVTELSARMAAFSATDTVQLNLTEAQQTLVTLLRADIPTVSVTESRVTAVSVAVADALLAALTDASGVLRSFSGVDTLTIGAVDDGTVATTELLLVASDALLTGITDASATTAQFTAVDALHLTWTAVAAVAAGITDVDTLAVVLSEAMAQQTLRFTTGDELALTVTETAMFDFYVFAADVLAILAGETYAISWWGLQEGNAIENLGGIMREYPPTTMTETSGRTMVEVP